MRSCPSDPEEEEEEEEEEEGGYPCMPLTQPRKGRWWWGSTGRSTQGQRSPASSLASAAPVASTSFVLIDEEAITGFIKMEFDADAGANIVI